MNEYNSGDRVKELFNTLVKFAPTAIIFLDMKGNIIECTDHTLKIFELPKEQLVRKNFLEIVHESEKDKVLAGLKQLIAQNTPIKSQLTLYKSGGKTFDAEVYANLAKDAYGKPFQIIVKVLDITEHKRIEIELYNARELLNILMEAIPDAIYFKDTLSRFTKVNRAHAERMGLKTPEEAVGKTDFDFYSEEFARQTYEDEQEIIRTGKPLINKVEKVVGKDGLVHWVTATKIPILDKNGKVTGIVGISRDITELKRVEETLRRYSEQLEKMVEEKTKALLEAERLAAIGEVVSMIVHDLRSPLQVILYKTFLLKEKLKQLPIPSYEKDSFKETLDSINEQVEYMNKMVSDLKDYARNIKPEYLEIDIKKLIEEVLATFIIPENVKIKVSVQKDFPKLLVDPMMIRRVLSNLISNAVDALPHGGNIYLETKIEGEQIVISVEDTGVGISEENLRKLFKPFFTTKDKGTGLGLAICKRFIELHGGQIFVESKPGVGTKFTIKLPLEGHIKR
ncbi:MAG: PAS domain S-box protein [Nitrososphaeria archaeon]|nr:PAS domain S-box protein [Nitrososphaeria archaeon]